MLTLGTKKPSCTISFSLAYALLSCSWSVPHTGTLSDSERFEWFRKTVQDEIRLFDGIVSWSC